VNDTVCLMCTPLVLALVEAAALRRFRTCSGSPSPRTPGSVATLREIRNMLIGR